jgi:hypothetical protein
MEAKGQEEEEDASKPQLIIPEHHFNESVVFLKHLEFNYPVQVYDDTTVPLRGKVTIHDTGCPIYDASRLRNPTVSRRTAIGSTSLQL